MHARQKLIGFDVLATVKLQFVLLVLYIIYITFDKCNLIFPSLHVPKGENHNTKNES
jgi:hypothetical protein